MTDGSFFLQAFLGYPIRNTPLQPLLIHVAWLHILSIEQKENPFADLFVLVCAF
jgi:hypothetical protein